MREILVLRVGMVVLEWEQFSVDLKLLVLVICKEITLSS
jgi:hypothetical protein